MGPESPQPTGGAKASGSLTALVRPCRDECSSRSRVCWSSSSTSSATLVELGELGKDSIRRGAEVDRALVHGVRDRQDLRKVGSLPRHAAQVIGREEIEHCSRLMASKRRSDRSSESRLPVV